MFRAQKQRTCHFCGEPQESNNRNTRDFRCRNCQCWNRFDVNGEILSSEPAMHEESLNSRAFSKRASPSKDRFPTQYGAAQFCHTCQTNQTLLNRMLSNYLPSEDSPDYKAKLAALPQYQAYAERKFPPLCATCAPAVEALIQQREQMARSHALSAWAKKSKGKQRAQISSGHKAPQKALSKQLAMWRLRGLLYCATTIAFIVGDTLAGLGYAPYHHLALLWPVLPLLVFVSIWYTAWDPTYASFRRAQVQGQEVKLRGRRTHISLQLLAWLSRLITSCLIALARVKPQHDHLHLLDHPNWSQSIIYFRVLAAIELSVLVASCFVPRLTRPPTIRLIDTKRPLSRAPSVAPTSVPLNGGFTEPDLLAGLSLSSAPSMPPAASTSKSSAAHVFGLPSFGPQRATPTIDEDEMAMDWTPTDPAAARRQRREEDDGTYIRPQRFFAPEHPTGLEGLLEKTRIDDDVPMDVDSSDHVANFRHTIRRFAHHAMKHWRPYLLVCALPVVLALGWRMWAMQVAKKTGRLSFDPPVTVRHVHHTTVLDAPVEYEDLHFAQDAHEGSL
ncbi:Ima1 N-terminal domain-containing protein [Schizophyllum amplum]|uniref:Ima1 N-terminal domain-containing protein n=1 Tax=Schizophyllum amplum TaxID=97359 RepID=A0A550C5U5_9AGAR|nr:Ima1 N-terminal domain-containing protein [Auriculariopsis ampla]